MGGGIDKVENTARGALTVTARVSNGASRYAMPTIPELVYAATLYKSAESPEYEKFVEGAKATNNDNLIFSFQRPDDTSGTFTLEVFAFVKAAGEGTTTFSRAGALLSGMATGLEITDGSDEIEVDGPIALSSSKQGTVNLKVTVPEGCSLEIDDTAKTNFAVEGTSPDFIIKQKDESGIPADSYPVIFTVKKGAETVHVFTESINVINGLCTDTWSGQEKGDAKAISQSAVSSTVFVRGKDAPWYASNAPSATASDEENTGSYLSPFATIQKAVDAIIARNDGADEYTIYVDGTFTATSSAALADFAAPSLTQKLSVKIAGLSASEKAVLDGGGTACGIVVGSTSAQKDVNLSLENLVIQNAKNPGSVVIRGGAIMLCCKAGNSHTIKNCEIKNNRAAYGSAIYSEYGSLDLQGCVISDNMTSANGAVSILYGATLTISSDVRIENNTFVGTQYGGGVYVGKDCDFTMTGGTISGNTATYGGGGVYVVAGGTFTMTGGTISGGNAKIGGGVYIAATNSAVGTFTMSGAASVPAGDDGKNDVYLSASGANIATITVAGALSDSTPVPIATITPSAYTAGTPILTKGADASAPVITQDICDKFALSDEDWKIVPAGMGSQGVLKTTTFYAASTGNDTTGNGTKAKPFATIQKAVDTVIAMNDGTSEYTIYVDGTLTQSAAPSGGNGMADFSALAKNLTLTIKALSGTATLDANQKSRVIYAKPASGTLNLMLENLVIMGGNVTGNGGGIYFSGKTLEMTDCEVIGCTTNSSGGGVYVVGTFTMNNGTIKNCRARGIDGGGGVSLSGGSKFIMESGATITGNTATNNGGGVSVYSASTFTMNGGTITGNTATNYTGGGVYIGNSNGKFTMNGGTVSANTANNGGGVSVFHGTFTMKSGTITGNTASTNGGGVYKNANGTFTKTGGTVSGNTPNNVYTAP